MTSRPAGVKKLQGREGWRVRVGDYRVVYVIDDDEKLLTVLEEIVLTRGEAEIVLKIDNLSLLEGISHVSRILPHVQHMNRTDSPAIMTEYYALNVPIERRRRSM